ncbi:MAG: hypothetical protein AAGI45_09650 [Cyanobacteria bacterium P01_H01_bin.26]
MASWAATSDRNRLSQGQNYIAKGYGKLRTAAVYTIGLNQPAFKGGS